MEWLLSRESDELNNLFVGDRIEGMWDKVIHSATTPLQRRVLAFRSGTHSYIELEREWAPKRLKA